VARIINRQESKVSPRRQRRPQGTLAEGVSVAQADMALHRKDIDYPSQGAAVNRAPGARPDLRRA